MADIGIITGSGFYDFPELKDTEEKVIKTPFGDAQVTLGIVHGKSVAFIARHGQNHALLPNMINYRANLAALKQLGTKCLISTTVCGILKPNIPLATPIVFDDLYFPENRLPSGEICTMFTTPGAKERGHYIFSTPFNETLRSALIRTQPDVITHATYAHVNGPRFNSKAEIRMLQSHADAVSQTSGPEVILAGELEIPMALIGFGVDYANGVKATPFEELKKNLESSKGALSHMILKFIKEYKLPQFDGFVYRFG